jgi:hypothetical protein
MIKALHKALETFRSIINLLLPELRECELGYDISKAGNYFVSDSASNWQAALAG